MEVPRFDGRHGFVCANVARILGNYTFGRGQGYVCSNNTGVISEQHPDSVRGPDVAYYATARRFGDLHPEYTKEVPTLAVEVLSPGDGIAKVHRLLSQLFSWGVILVWVFDPEDFAVTVYRRDRGLLVVEADQELSGKEVLPEFRHCVAEFFLMPGEKLPNPPTQPG
jgi:Uma2 family endonuclease